MNVLLHNGHNADSVMRVGREVASQMYPEAVEDKPWARVTEVDKATARITIEGPIVEFMGYSSRDFNRDVADISDNVKNVFVDINSPGGLVFDGFSIYNTIRELSATKNVTTVVKGMAASIAGVIFLAADNRMMYSDTSMVMLHNSMGVAIGHAANIRKTVNRMEKIDERLVDIVHSVSNLERKDVVSALDAETWYSASEAKSNGMANEVVSRGRKDGGEGDKNRSHVTLNSLGIVKI